jgi:PAS domain S-box-containing protein
MARAGSTAEAAPIRLWWSGLTALVMVLALWFLVWLVASHASAVLAALLAGEPSVAIEQRVARAVWQLWTVGILASIGIVGLALLLDFRDRELRDKERQARVAERRLIDAIETIPDGFALFDAQDRLVVFNAAYKELYRQSGDVIVPGTTFEEIVRRGAALGQYPGAIGRVEDWVAERLAAHSTPVGPFEQELADGRWVRIEERRTTEGGIVGVRADITTIKQREMKLARQTTLLSTTFEHMSEGIAVVDAKGDLIASNQQLLQLLDLPAGVAGSDLAFADLLDLFCLKDRKFADQETEDIGDIVRGIVGGAGGLHHWTSDAGRTLEVAGSPLPDGGCVITFGDITDRRATLARLEASEAQKSAIIAGALDAVIIADELGRVLVFNRAAEELFAYSAEEAMGRRLQELIIPPDLREAHALAMRRFLDTGVAKIIDRRVEVPAIDKHGRRFPIEITISATKVDRRYVFSAYMRDISERKRIEAEREAARKAAEAASRAKSDFLAMVSHEVRTPMNGIIGLSGLLLDTSLDDVQRRYAQGIDNSANHLLGLVNEILDFSRIEAGRIDIKAEPFEMRALVESAAETTRALVRDRAIEVVATVAEEVPHRLIGDAGRLQQVLQNLLGNSAKFTSEGRIALRILSRGEGPNGHGLRIEVEDTGIGIPAERRSRLFEPFEQGDASINVRFGGTGLGLAITRRLIELMGGTIGVESMVGVGSTFAIDLVLPADVGRDFCADEAPPVAIAADLSTVAPLRVLVAEDAPINQLVVRAMLEKAGHVVRVVGDGAEAVEAARGGSFDIAILDLQMPVMSGWEALAGIRALPGPVARMPIIALTAQATAADVAATLAAGFDRHVSKPVRFQELLGVLGDLIVERRRAVEPQEVAEPSFASVEERAPAPEGGAPDEIDDAVLADLRAALGEEAFRGLVAELVADAGRHLGGLKDRLEADDEAGLRREAHRLAGLLGQFGCSRAADLCGALETAPSPTASTDEVRHAIGAGERAILHLRRRILA